MPAKTEPAKHQPATGGDIREMLGQVDHDLVASILHTGASRHEIAEAARWLDSGEYGGAPMDARIRNVYDILLSDRDRMDGD